MFLEPRRWRYQPAFAHTISVPARILSQILWLLSCDAKDWLGSSGSILEAARLEPSSLTCVDVLYGVR